MNSIHLFNLSSFKSAQRLAITLLVMLLCGATAVRLYADASQPQSDAEAAIAQLQANLAPSDSYRFTAQIEQTLIPRATGANIGRSEERIDSQLIGQVSPEKNVLDLRFEGNNMPNLLLEQTDGNTYLIQNGERTLINSPLATSTQDGSFAGYLHAVTNVVERHDPDFPNYTIYQFELDADAYAAYLVEQMRANLPANQQYRSGLPAKTVALMSGSGEIWLDADAVLRRQIIDITMPEVNEQYGAQSHIVVDYQYAGQADVIDALPETAAPMVVISAEITTPTVILPPYFTTHLLFLLLACGFCFILLRRPRSLRSTLPFFLAFVMVANPLLQSVAYAASNNAPKPQSLTDVLQSTQQQANVLPAEDVIDARTPLLAQSNDACGSSSDKTTDTDGDGLTDYVETCLGTSPYAIDTDNDRITDTLEVNGFVFTDTQGTVTTFYSDPLSEDSNLDKRADTDEWPAPHGFASSWDIDGDDIPNLWDFDDDGDGVDDSLDLNPSVVTEYKDFFRLNVSASQSGFDGYQILNFQVQPEDHDHLRYVLSTLDWPSDSQGTIKDEDGSTDDISLVPYMKIYSSTPPSDELLDQYGVIKFSAEVSGWYDLYVPLTPIGIGGSIDAFAGTLAFDFANRSSVGLREMELIWFANYTDDEGEVTPIAEYTEEAFRFTGLDISKENHFDYAVIGTPNDPTDNLKLFQTMFALQGTFLESAEIDLDTLETRFNTPSTPITQTWGVAASDVSIAPAAAAPQFLDKAAGQSAESAVNYLINKSYPESELATLLVATEGEAGSISLQDMTLRKRSFSVNLDSIPTGTIRNLHMTFFDYESGAWSGASPETVTEALFARHDFKAIATALQTDYPDLEESDLLIVLALFISRWETGLMSMISYDGLTTAPATVDDADIRSLVTVAGVNDIISYLIEVAELAIPDGGLIFADYDHYQQLSYDYTTEENWRPIEFFTLTSSSLIVGTYSTIKKIKKAQVFKATTLYQSVYYASVAKWTAINSHLSAKYVSQVATGTTASGTLILAPQFSGGSLAKISYFLSKHAKKVAIAKTAFLASLEVIGLGIELTQIWVQYVNFHSVYSYERTTALIYAVSSTVITVVLAVLSLFPITGYIIMAIELYTLVADLIASALGYSGFSLKSTLIAEAIRFVVDFNPLTRVRTLDFEGLVTSSSGPAVVGSAFTFKDKFTGVIQAATYDSVNELTNSNSYGYFQARSNSSAISISTSHEASIDNCRNENYRDSAANRIYSHSQVCRNELSAYAKFEAPAVNASVSLRHAAVFNTRFQTCYTLTDCDDPETDPVEVPNELAEESRWDFIDIYIDILPNTVEGLWTWSALVSNQSAENNADAGFSDIDADGLTYSEEVANGSDATRWDTDGDSLSDAFEIASADELGTNLLLADSDGDGLDDGLEFRIGTLVNTADSDTDALTDGQEIFHHDGAQWTGGGWRVAVDGVDYFVFTSPFPKDLEGDGLSDASELFTTSFRDATRSRAVETINTQYGSSPDADNADAPTITFDGGPTQIAPNGGVGIYAAQGDVVTATATVFNNGVAPIDDTVTLCLPASGLTNINISTSGDRVPPTHTNANCYAWDFSGNPLLYLQSFNVSLSALGNSGTTAGAFILSVPYTNLDGDRVVQEAISFTLDNSAPTVSISEPISHTRLAGDYFVMGGYSADDDSWVDHVKITVPSGTYTATDTAPWAYTWDLPDDGIVTVSVVAYDALGNASDPVAVQVTVDSLAPTITTSFADGATIAAGEAYSNMIQLSGNVSDNYAGIVRVQLAANNQPWRTIWSTDTPQLNTTWSGEWTLPAITASAQGEHTLRLRAWDDYGNIGLIEQTVFVDLLPPTNELTDRRFTQDTIAHVPLNQPLTLQGVANDAGNNPIAAGPVALEGALHSIDDATVWLQPDTIEVDDAGVTVAWIGDYNGDRLGDFAVGFPNGADGRGKVVVVTGAAGDWPNPKLGDMETLFGRTPTFIGDLGAGLGTTIVPAGDFDGDGFEEFLIGDLANNRIFMLYGTPATQGAEILLDGTPSSHWAQIVLSAQATDTQTLTTQFAAAGDVNNDSYADILVATDSAVYLLVGDDTPHAEQQLDTLAAATLAVSNASVAGVGDVTGDLIDDFAIATGNSVYLFAGGSGWVEAGVSGLTTDIAIATFATNDTAPTIIKAGDLNGDSFADFAFTNGSTPTVVYGSNSGSYTTETLGGFASTLGRFLAAAGDTNKDGNSDLLVGNVDGNAYLLLGGSLNSVASTIEGVAGSASAPYTKGADLAGDGSADLLLVPSASATTGAGFSTRTNALSSAQPAFIPAGTLPQQIYDFGLTIYDDASRRSLTGDVTAGSADADFTRIQDAINSGASRVLIEPGIYYEAITLTDNVIVAGSGAGLTTLALPVGESVLVSAENVTNAALLNLRLQGNGVGTGVAATNGSTLALERLLIESMATAVAIDGASNNVDLKNNSLIANVNGINATNCAELDVRNTVFAYNTGTALAYEACAAVKRHEFNLYYANGTDMMPNNPGSGELFSNPLFLNFGAGDYRVATASPVINAGSPGDAVPPGAGGIIDIGHIEQTGGGYLASVDYCATCDNDGLIWGVNAFNTIQGAVDSAEKDLLNLFDGTGSQFTVGVDTGVYTESVEIKWNLQLLGSDPDNTTIQGVGGPAVTISATVGTKLGGFTLLGGGANRVGVHVTGGSNSIELTRNLIKNNAVGVLFDGRSSGELYFNTLIDNTTAVEAVEQYNWADTHNNIISGNANGLVATDSAVIFSENNLLFNTVDFTNVLTGINDMLGSNPLLNGPHAHLTAGSPAIDAGSTLFAVPSGGGVAPDIGWHELRIAPISILMGQADASVATESYGVGSAEYAIVAVASPTSPISSTLPTTWSSATLDSAGETVSYWSTTYTPTATGYYRIYSRAVDGLGNAELDSTRWYDGAFYVDSTAPTVSIEAELVESTNDNWLLMTGIVTDYVGASFDIEEIYFMVNGERVEARWSLDGWQADGVSGRTFNAVYMNNTGGVYEVDVQAFAVDGARQTGSSPILSDIFVQHSPIFRYYDNTPPRFREVSHEDNHLLPIVPFNDIYSGTVTIEAQAVDTTINRSGAADLEMFTGINGYQISFDGGLTWNSAERGYLGLGNVTNGRMLPYEWVIPDGLDATTIPVKIRVTDYDGNSRIAVTHFTVDTGAPRLVGEIYHDDGPALGQHFEHATDIDFSWDVPIDGSGELTMLGSFGTQTPDVAPSSIMPDNRETARVAEAGAYYASVGARDEAGNIAWRAVGPWYAGQGIGIQSLEFTIDGTIDLAHGEYLSATEWLDTDSRSGRPLSLYNVWGYDLAFSAWQGADWDTDGAMWLYYDLLNGGTSQPISTTGNVALPFDADYAISYTGSNDTVRSWQFVAGAWTETYRVWQQRVNQAERVVEAQIGFEFDIGQSANQHMLGYAVDDDGDVWATFPRTNSLNGQFEHYYDWNISERNDLLKLPAGARAPLLAFGAESDPSIAATLTHADTVTYVVTIDNNDGETADTVQLQLYGSAGVAYQTMANATCADCTVANAWLLDVPTIAINQSRTVTVVAQLDADLTGLDTVTTTVSLISAETPQSTQPIVHQLDLSTPTVNATLAPGNSIGTGRQTVRGTASDDAGAGIALVEVSTDGTNWVSAEGTETWTAEIDIPTTRSSAASLHVRATDYHGQIGDVQVSPLVLDTVAPLITPTVPALVGNRAVAGLTGVASDPAPISAEVAIVEVQFNGNGVWLSGSVDPANANGQHTWSYQWGLPTADGTVYSVQYRATDYAGNSAETGTYNITVDTVPPTVAVTTYAPMVQDINPNALALSGTVSDGGGLGHIRVLLYPETGSGSVLTPTLDNGNWSISLFGQPLGSYTLIVEATDTAGNETVSEAYAVEVTDTVPTSVVSLSDIDASAAGNAAQRFAIFVGFLGLAWFTLSQLRRKRQAQSCC